MSPMRERGDSALHEGHAANAVGDAVGSAARGVASVFSFG
jgi:hypothetical protein